MAERVRFKRRREAERVKKRNTLLLNTDRYPRNLSSNQSSHCYVCADDFDFSSITDPRLSNIDCFHFFTWVSSKARGLILFEIISEFNRLGFELVKDFEVIGVRRQEGLCWEFEGHISKNCSVSPTFEILIHFGPPDYRKFNPESIAYIDINGRDTIDVKTFINNIPFSCKQIEKL